MSIVVQDTMGRDIEIIAADVQGIHANDVEDGYHCIYMRYNRRKLIQKLSALW